MVDKVIKTDAEWKASLPDQVYRIARKQGTEPAFTGPYHAEKKPGVYHCACCGQELFDAKTKFDSGTGWPSFWAPVKDEAVETKADYAKWIANQQRGPAQEWTGEVARLTGKKYQCVNCHVFNNSATPNYGPNLTHLASREYFAGGMELGNAFSEINDAATQQERFDMQSLQVEGERGDPDYVEATAFAWLARQSVRGETGNLPEVTGARGPRILGALYPC